VPKSIKESGNIVFHCSRQVKLNNHSSLSAVIKIVTFSFHLRKNVSIK